MQKDSLLRAGGLFAERGTMISLNNKDAIMIMEHVEDVRIRLRMLQREADMGIMDLVEAADDYAHMTKKEKALQEKFVAKVHVRSNGEKRSITEHKPTDRYPRGYWCTIMPNGIKKRYAQRDDLIAYLYDFYSGELADRSVEAIFNKALHEKIISENPSYNTIYKNGADYRRFISEDFAKRDIRRIDEVYLKSYTQEWVNRKNPKKAMYMCYKGTLNLIFDYAFTHRIINDNPVKAIKNKVYLKSCDTRPPRPEDEILSPEEINILRNEVRRRMKMQKYGRYYVNGFALLFSIETGVRVGELCSVMWSDVYGDYIHIHTQQLSDRKNGKKEYHLDYKTKNEKGISTDGRKYPLTDAIAALLDELRQLQKDMGIRSDFIFCHEDGDWIKKDAYITFLRRLCRSLGFKVHDNHALRKSLNSNVLIPLGISAADRAAMLGHSIETNLRYYSFAQKNYLTDVRDRLNKGLAKM